MWLDVFRLPHEISFAPYGQVLQSLLDPRSHLSRESRDLNIVLVRLQDFSPDSETQLLAHTNEFLSAIKAFSAAASSQTIVCVCPSNATTAITEVAFKDAEQKIQATVATVPGVSLIPSTEMQASYPVDACYDEIADRTGHIPYTAEFYVSLATTIFRRMRALYRTPSKFIALDCDNTLWDGVCGELGPQQVRITEAHKTFQTHLLEIRSRGILLTLASKNNEQDVWDVFDAHPDMILRREHIAAAAINWNAKSSNLRALAGELRLGVNSCVLLDDNPVEIAEVNANCRDAIAVQVPAATDLDGFLDHVWPLDQLAITDEDRRRAESYQVEARRADFRDEFVSLRDFLSNLQLRITFASIGEDNIERAAQLTQRTNQFNCSLKRQTVNELKNTLTGPARFGYLVDVSDKFGDYGFVGLLYGDHRDSVLHVNAFMLSCRALGRGVERAMMRKLGELAAESNCSKVSVKFIPGPRNQPAADFLNGIAMRDAQDSSPTECHFEFRPATLSNLDPLEATANERGTSSANRAPTATDGVSNHSQTYNQIANQYRSVAQIVDRLHKTAGPRSIDQPLVPPRDDVEQRISAICREVMHLQEVGVTDALKDLGATSLHIVQIHSRLVRELGYELSITELYTLPSIRTIAERTKQASSSEQTVASIARPVNRNQGSASSGVAVVGMAGRFPGADNVRELWDNLMNGVNCISEIAESELNLPEDSPLRAHPNLVRKSAAVKDADKFDAKFFGIFPKEAQVMDPQHRLMLECCWHAMEDAGYQPDAVNESVGVFAGCYMDTYILASLTSNPKLLASLANSFHGGDLHTELGNDKDYLATRISFLLNLRGPAITIQTACSTSLVAIIQACQAIQLGQCNMALAGGSTLKLPQNRGYLYSEGGMVSPDGICRPFDADARGTVFGEGVGAVLLKNLDDAIADGDDIYGVIRGWGINNDGHSKMGYTAPSVEGQSTAVLTAHQHAGFSADTITYMEAHGTGTALGDPIEIDALTRAFRASTDKKQFCAIGSVKSNIGHLDVAAGVTGVMKSCLAMKHGVIPENINFKRPNPNIDLENSPFYVASEKQSWECERLPTASRN